MLPSRLTGSGVELAIMSIWHAAPAEAAAYTRDAVSAHPGRFLLGLGTSHAVLVEGDGTAYRKPYSKMVACAASAGPTTTSSAAAATASSTP
ncbi:hypothetical protein AMIS_28880 [Actinoplanes missouriensis 431]|uniref:Luciferase-like domain-containing protein n=2 Tax=Actinoplanes missouriensis TaxID=1866 RepID=I0H521_ACTM4|nr:hypothetical protein AMIS_28880 [Actinoplanes missouriensis 431]